MERILLVDDDDQFALVIQKALAHAEYDVVRARNGKEALALYNPHAVSLVLTDLIMPDMEGLELIEELRRTHPKVKVIAMSGGGRNHPEVYLRAARNFGAIKTLVKPFPLVTLLTGVRECLDSP